MPVNRPLEVVAAVLGPPRMTIRIKGERYLVTHAIGDHGPLRVVAVSTGRGLAHVEGLDGRTAGRGTAGGVIPVVVGPHGDEDDVRVLGGDGDGPRGVHALRDARDDGLLAGRGAGRGVVAPRPHLRGRAGVERLAIRREG